MHTTPDLYHVLASEAARCTNKQPCCPGLGTIQPFSLRLLPTVGSSSEWQSARGGHSGSQWIDSAVTVQVTYREGRALGVSRGQVMTNSEMTHGTSQQTHWPK